MENIVKLITMKDLKKKIIICNFTKTISSAVLTAIAINIITKYALMEGIIPFALAITIVLIIDLYQYRCEKEDKINLNELEERIQKLEGEE